MSEIALPAPSPRDRDVQAAVLPLVEAYAWAEAAAVLQARLQEIAETRRRHVEALLLEWYELPEEGRPDFLSYAHNRRMPELGGE